jgi:hypothetical protein
MNTFFAVLGLGLVGAIFWLLRQSRKAAQGEVIIVAQKLDKERRVKSDRMEKTHDEETEKILNDLGRYDDNRVRSPIHRRDRS